MSAKAGAECVAEEAPVSDELTDYDRAHLLVYLRLLDAQADGASEREMCRIVLGIDPDDDARRASKALRSHLRRAHWISEKGYRDLLREGR